MKSAALALGIVLETLGVFLLLGEAVMLGGNLNIGQMNQISLDIGLTSLLLMCVGFVLLVVGYVKLPKIGAKMIAT